MHTGKMLVYDLVGICLTAAMLCAAAWCSFVDQPRHKAKANHYNEVLQSLDRELQSLTRTAADARAKVGELEADIEARGALPEEAPVEDHLQLLDRLARAHALDMVQVTPVSRLDHEALTETRYEVHANCAYQGLLGFLREFKEATAWADITEVQLTTTGTATDATPQQSVRIVLSLYARRPMPAVSDVSG